MRLRDYQQRAIDDTIAWLTNNTGHPCLELPTGAGKSVIVAELCRKMAQDWGSNVTMVTSSKELVQQNAERMRSEWPNAPLGVYSAGLRKRELGNPITFAGIQSIYKRASEMPPQHMLIVDECHLINHDNEGMFRQFVNELTERSPGMRVVGLTATPFRMGHGLITDEPAIFKELIQPTSIEELIYKGYLSPLRSKLTGLKYDVSGVHKRGGEFIEGELAAAVDTGSQNDEVVRETIAIAGERNSWLFFCTGVLHAMHLRDSLTAHGVSAACITGDTPAAQRDDIIARFKAGEIKALTNANVLTTGFDHPGLDLIVMARPTMSPGLYCLDNETEVLTRSGWVKCGGDTSECAAYDVKTGSISWEPAAQMARPRRPDERMFSYMGPGLDIRVTENHRMVARGRRSDYRIFEARNMLAEATIPCAGLEGTDGAQELSHSDLMFLGIFLSDGSLNKANNAITITQSERYPYVIDATREAIKGCGFKSTEHVRNDATNFGERKYPLHIWTISKGEPRGRDKHLTGWGRLGEWVDKSIPSQVYDRLSREQLETLLLGLHYGDGTKRAGATWTPRTYSIATARKDAADRLQSLCVRRGMRCNITREGSANLWMVRVAPNKDSHTLPSRASDSRPVFSSEAEWREEMVWCVEVSTGAIVTRRNGKVAVLGNCQMAGRGLRIAEGKSDCLVLDFAGVVEAHGPITAVQTPKKVHSSGNGEAPTKACDECHEIVAASTKECPTCGAKFPEPEKAPLQLRDDDIMKVETQEMEVQSWVWEKHHSKNSEKDMLRVHYYGTALDDPTITEYLCVRHQGYAYNKAVRVLKEIEEHSNAAVNADDDLDAAVGILNLATPPKGLTYKKNGRFWDILNKTWGPTPTEAVDYDALLEDDDIPF